MVRAGVPEAPIDKYSDPARSEHDVRTASKAKHGSMVNPEPQTPSMKLAAESELRCRVATSRRAHRGAGVRRRRLRGSILGRHQSACCPQSTRGAAGLARIDPSDRPLNVLSVSGQSTARRTAVPSHRGTALRLDRKQGAPDPADFGAVRDWLSSQPGPTAVDLFSGGGGLSLGLADAGFSVLLGADSDPGRWRPTQPTSAASATAVI